MKKWLTHGIIAAYLSALSWGIIAHTINFGTGAHPAMYYVVWDMFCGWASYSGRIQIIGQGESGRYYQLAPGPWGEMKPFGRIGRRHYDVQAAHAHRFALNALKHTKHEPIVRVFVIEESWAKQYNLPDDLWNRWHEEPKDPHKYYHVRRIFTPDGALVKNYPTWLSLQYSMAISDNPRLLAEKRRGEPFFVYRRSPGRRIPAGGGSTLLSAPAFRPAVGSGN